VQRAAVHEHRGEGRDRGRCIGRHPRVGALVAVPVVLGAFAGLAEHVGRPPARVGELSRDQAVLLAGATEIDRALVLERQAAGLQEEVHGDAGGHRQPGGDDTERAAAGAARSINRGH
jgi:hypothetical protein